MEMNTRLQVRALRTEMAPGQDLVERQMKSSLGKSCLPLPKRRKNLRVTHWKARDLRRKTDKDFPCRPPQPCRYDTTE